MTDAPAFERFEQELHTLVMALESELVSEELSRYDKTVTVPSQPHQQSMTTSDSCPMQPLTLAAHTRPPEPFEDGTFAENVYNYIVRKGSTQPSGTSASIPRSQAA